MSQARRSGHQSTPVPEPIGTIRSGGGGGPVRDRRLVRVAARRVPVDEVARVLELFETRYWDFTAKHFHEELVAEHGCERSNNWVRLTLQVHGPRA